MRHLLLTMLFVGVGVVADQAHAAKGRGGSLDGVKQESESQVRRLLEPLLDKYCHDECKIMGVDATVDVASPDEIAPGFDDIDPKSAMRLAPSSATVKLLIADKVGPVSRNKLLELIQQFLDTLDYPVKVETLVAHFPQPLQSAGKVAEIRERITKQFKGTMDQLFGQFCPAQCLLADYQLQTEVVNVEEAQYGGSGEFFQDGDTAIRIRNIVATILVDDALTPEERVNITEMAKLKTNYFKNVDLTSKTMKFPRPRFGEYADGDNWVQGGGRGLAGKSSKSSENNTLDSKSTSNNSSENKSNSSLSSEHKSKEQSSSTSKNEQSNTVNNSNSESSTSARQERFERFEKIERVENGDAVQAELQKFKVFGLIFACSVLSLLIFLAVGGLRPRGGDSTVHKIFQTLNNEGAGVGGGSAGVSDERAKAVALRYEIDRLIEELSKVFAEQPRVAKQVFTRILTEEGVETTAQLIHIFGEGIVVDMLRDASLQNDLNELMEYYAKNPIEITDEDKLELLRQLHNRTVAGKMMVMGKRSGNLFDFLMEMDGTQVFEMIRNESLTVKAIILTQVDNQKRTTIYSQLDEDARMKLLSELSRIDYLPRDYIFNVATALRRKRRENPKLNTEALPGSEVLVSLLERSSPDMQKSVVKSLELSNPDSARTIKGKLVSVETLKYLRDGQLLEVILSLRHDELLQFLKGAPAEVRSAIFSKSPKDLVTELEEELTAVSLLSREGYQAVERKVLNRMKVMATEGIISLVETNERMLGENRTDPSGVEAGPSQAAAARMKKVAGW